MRKILYSFVFASILLLAGFTSFAGFDEPGDGGTVPTYEVWLPVVERNVPEGCKVTSFEVVRSTKPHQQFPVYKFENATHDEFYSMVTNGYTNEPVIVATDPLLQDVVYNDLMYENGVRSLAIYAPFAPERTYYTKFEYTCLGFLMSTSVFEFIIIPW